MAQLNLKNLKRKMTKNHKEVEVKKKNNDKLYLNLIE